MTAPSRRPIGARDACASRLVRDRIAANDGPAHSLNLTIVPRSSFLAIPSSFVERVIVFSESKETTMCQQQQNCQGDSTYFSFLQVSKMSNFNNNICTIHGNYL
ncbi:hypothetical protein CAJAP_04292 [Camponotus japonicus]